MIGTQFQLWVTMISFRMFLIAILIGFLQFIASLLLLYKGQRQAGMLFLSSGSLYVMAVFGLVMWVNAFPKINDVTTDLINPPSFVFAQSLPGNQGRDFSYPQEFIESAQKAYGKLKTFIFDQDLDVVFNEVVKAISSQPDMKVTYQNQDLGQIEAVATSRFFRFQDDIVVRLKKSEDGKTLVDFRSKSRLGKGDFGANFRRIIILADMVETSLQK